MRVVLTAPLSNLPTLSKLILDNLLRNMRVQASSSIRSSDVEEDGTVELEINGDDSGLLIGRRGETLQALQYVTNLLVGRRAEGRVVLDVEGYRERRYAALRTLAVRVAERVASTGQSVTLEPMAANERRVIHLALAENSRVVTESTGVGEGRKITVSPARG